MMSAVEEKRGGGQSRQGQQEKTKVIAIGGRGDGVSNRANEEKK